MEPSKTVYLRCSVKFTLNGQDRIDFDSLKGLVLINSVSDRHSIVLQILNYLSYLDCKGSKLTSSPLTMFTNAS